MMRDAVKQGSMRHCKPEEGLGVGTGRDGTGRDGTTTGARAGRVAGIDG